MNEEEIDIIDTIGLQSTLYNDFISRYFTKYFLPENKFIFIHSNNIILCGISKNHFLLNNNIIINNIIDCKKLGKITGRNKHGGIFINENETIININYTNKDNNESNVYKFCTGIKGKLIEVNKNIINNNNLIKEDPLGDGFICILQMDLKEVQKLKEKLSNNNDNNENI